MAVLVEFLDLSKNVHAKMGLKKNIKYNGVKKIINNN